MMRAANGQNSGCEQAAIGGARRSPHWLAANGISAIVWLTLAAVFVAARLPFWRHTMLNPDAISYWSVGRSLAHGRGLFWDIKPYFYPDNGRITAPVVGYLSVPYTVLLGIIAASGASFREAAIASGLVGFIDCILLYALVRRFASRWTAFAVCLLFLMNPTVLASTVTLWTEPLATAFALGCYLIAARWLMSNPIPSGGSAASGRAPALSMLEGFCCGLCLGLAFLTRPAEIVYAPVIVIISILVRRLIQAAGCVVGLLAVLAPYCVANRALNGSPTFTMYALLQRTVFYGDAMYAGFGRHYPSAGFFLRTHGGVIVSEELRNWALCIRLLGSPGELGCAVRVLLLFIGAAVVAGMARRLSTGPRSVPPTGGPVRMKDIDRWAAIGALPLAIAMALGALGHLAGTIAVWSTHEEARFVLATWLFALALILPLLELSGTCTGVVLGERLADIDGSPAVRLAARALPALLAAAAVLAAVVPTFRSDLRDLRSQIKGAFWDHGCTWREYEAARYAPVCRQLCRLSRRGDQVAASDPWIVNYLCGHPTVLLPALRSGELPRFLSRYRIDWVVADPGRMPQLQPDDDFSQEVRDDREARDWQLRRLSHDPNLEEVPIPESRGSARLYRVRQVPIPGSVSGAGGPTD